MRRRRTVQMLKMGAVGVLITIAIVALTTKSEPERVSIARFIPAWDPPHPFAGPSPRFTAELIPDAVITEAGQQSIEYHAELTSLVDSSGSVAWSATVVDDVGHLVQDLGKGQELAGAKGTVTTPALRPRLADGYFFLRVRAAIAGAELDEVADATQYLVVKNGVTSEMSYDDWSKVSRDTLAVLMPESNVPTSSPPGGVK
jgi:hypothetical protein